MTLTGVLICLALGFIAGGIYGYLLGAKALADDADWWESL